MTPQFFTYLLIALYAALVYALSWVGMRRTGSAAGFAIGNKDMSPYLVGITLAASISSTATFVIPGLCLRPRPVGLPALRRGRLAGDTRGVSGAHPRLPAPG